MAVIGVSIYAAITQTDKGTLHFKNPYNGRLREAPVGFSWTTLFFFFFLALFRGHILGALIMYILLGITGGLSILIFPFFYNKWYIKHLINDGFKVSKVVGDIDSISKYLDIELPMIEPQTPSQVPKSPMPISVGY